MFSFVTKMFPAIFSVLARPTELKLAHRVGTMLNCEFSPDSFIEAVMMATQRKEGPLGQNGPHGAVPLSL